MTDIRSPQNRLKNWNGTVHYADNGTPACGPVLTHSTWLSPSVATVTCARCIAKFGADEPGHEDAPVVDENVARRAAERAARQATRQVCLTDAEIQALAGNAAGTELVSAKGKLYAALEAGR